MRKLILRILLGSIILSSFSVAKLTQEEVSMLYVSLFNRASEGEGNRYWQTNQPDMVSTANVILETSDAKEYFGSSLDNNQAFIEHIYKNTLNKTIDDDPKGIEYWTNELNDGRSRGQVVVALIGALLTYKDTNDTVAKLSYQQFMNRVEVSNYMAEHIEKAPKDYKIATSFNGKLKVTSSKDSINVAKVLINTFSTPTNSYETDGVIHNVSNITEFRQALEDASINGENDIIVLAKGVYKTTDDGIGTFEFSDEEEYNLTIKSAEGLSYKDIILDGNNTHQVFNFNNSANSTLFFKGVSVINGKEGIYCNRNIEIRDCNISNNSSSYKGGGFYSKGITKVVNSIISNNNGGGFYSSDTTTIIDSNISNNNNSSDYGGGFYSSSATTIINSNISNNSSDYGGGGFYSDSTTIVTSSNISNNSSNYGGGFYSDSTTIVTSSNISNNSSNYGGGFYSDSTTIVTSSNISNNSSSYKGGGFYSTGKIIMANSIFFENNGAIFYSDNYYSNNSYISNNSFIGNKGSIYAKGVFVNNIFSENDADINLYGDSKIYNNYIDYSKIEENGHNVIKKHNLQPILVGDIYLADDNVTLTENSPAIDKGLNPNSEAFKKLINNDEVYNRLIESLQTDKLGNRRVYNGTIDMGAVEYGTSK